MSYWTFSDVFEEQGVVKKPFYGGFGLIAAENLPKPAFNAFKMLHMLGETKIPASGDDLLATKRADGRLAIALWNMSATGLDTKAKGRRSAVEEREREARHDLQARCDARLVDERICRDGQSGESNARAD